MSELVLHIDKIGAAWMIRCDVCDPPDMFNLWPWVTTTEHAAAVVLADWHLRLHRQAQCACCGHMPRLDRPEVVDRTAGLFRQGGVLHRLTVSGVTRMTEEVPA